MKDRFNNSAEFKNHCHKLAANSKGKIKASQLMNMFASEKGYETSKKYCDFLDSIANKPIGLRFDPEEKEAEFHYLVDENIELACTKSRDEFERICEQSKHWYGHELFDDVMKMLGCGLQVSANEYFTDAEFNFDSAFDWIGEVTFNVFSRTDESVFGFINNIDDDTIPVFRKHFPEPFEFGLEQASENLIHPILMCKVSIENALIELVRGMLKATFTVDYSDDEFQVQAPVDELNKIAKKEGAGANDMVTYLLEKLVAAKYGGLWHMIQLVPDEHVYDY